MCLCLYIDIDTDIDIDLTSLATHLFMNTCCFHILAVVNNAAMNTGVRVFFRTGVFTVWRSLNKLKIESPYDPAIPLLGIYLEKTLI